MVMNDPELTAEAPSPPVTAICERVPVDNQEGLLLDQGREGIRASLEL
jgi:hypothetical protein